MLAMPKRPALKARTRRPSDRVWRNFFGVCSVNRMPTLSRTALVAILALAATSGAMAQSKKELAQKVLVAQQGSIDNIASSIAGNTSQQILETAAMALERVPAAKREGTAKAIQEDVKKFFNDIEPLLKASASKQAPGTVGPILEDKFSEDELRQIAAWLESPAAKKYQQLGTEMQGALTQKIVADTRPAVEGKLKALESTIGGRLDAAGGEAPAAAKPKKK